ncbi:unnamed protein product [Microthlaspi erraticum]|uniref:Retrovirus-related Pol polyprotein from transposon TNT 1-94-like beta-barrel domain-containing protein n=1 Tax=Microthlaspi erraticum TaxID=1685480 RepID=A0A6D2J416_9BRAS|nr:unnamed protein product [Microthlaspi erraticum]
MGKDKFLHTPPQASRSKLNQRSSNGSATSVARWATKLMFTVAKLVQVKTKEVSSSPHRRRLCVVVTEVNNVEDNPREWWYDTGATTHICNDRDMFSTYQKCNNGERLLMGNTGSSKIEGRGKVVLKMTSGNNLISGTLMSKAGFATNFESDKLVLKKHGFTWGKGYVKDGLVKMCVMPVIRN